MALKACFQPAHGHIHLTVSKLRIRGRMCVQNWFNRNFGQHKLPSLVITGVISISCLIQSSSDWYLSPAALELKFHILQTNY